MKKMKNNINNIIIILMKTFNIDINKINYTLRLGENAKENHNIIDYSDPDDWWFHLNDYPSGHCIVESSIINDELIIYASNLVKINSKYKNNKNIKVKYIQVKHIKKTKNPGKVILLNICNEIII